MSSKWDEKLPLIKELAGVETTAEIARQVGTSVNNLHKICFNNNISLPRDPESWAKGPRAKSQAKEIQKAIELLTDNGYRVTARDPFRKVSANTWEFKVTHRKKPCTASAYAKSKG